MNKVSAVLAISLLGLSLGTVVQSRAEIDLSATTSAVDPITKLPPDKWAQLAMAVINGKSVVGKPVIFMINATGQELSAVTCDGKWQLVGPTPYIKGAPANLPAWKVTLVPTEGFDNYCKRGIVAQSDNGMLYPAALVSVDGTFTNAAFLTFRVPQ